MFLYTSNKICHLDRLYGLTLRSHATLDLHRSTVKVIITDYVKKVKILIARKLSQRKFSKFLCRSLLGHSIYQWNKIACEWRNDVRKNDVRFRILPILSMNAIFIVFELNEVNNSVNSNPNIMYLYTRPDWLVLTKSPKFCDEWMNEWSLFFQTVQ